MGILNVTPDSFSDGGRFIGLDNALSHAESLISDGADIIDIGGESTRPGSERASVSEEIDRVVPVIEAVVRRFGFPVSVDTNKSAVARAAVDAGAEVINDISGLRWEPEIANVAAESNAGVVLMHSRGEFETMHSQVPVPDIISEISNDFRRALDGAESAGVHHESIALDVGIGFSKTFEQNLELIAKLDRLVDEFPEFPILVGTSRKSFIGKVLDGVPTDQRLSGSLASVAIAVWNGAKIVRVHDVKESVDVVKTVEAIKNQAREK